MAHVLQLDIRGQPLGFVSLNDAALAYATDAVAWTVGDEPLFVMRGGFNARTGRQSTLAIHPIIAMRGCSKVNLHDVSPSLTNPKLFRRDRMQCAYCGVVRNSGLTREHVVPTSRGGADSWSNVVSACSGCNARKADKSLKEAGMELLYLPYVPSLHEDLLLQGRNIRADVHDWLASRLPKNSRLS
ncbi:HNH endonuclease [Ottowia sp.]|uniref:HNH endonuclease n=1 Tax=Ottowia sp. TaxID=1898956 RepID=UPI0025EE4821|nr:HNH endonuclease [Ottowia sp.]MBK6616181.1 HNH endonuclease [Ottowia sp.]